MVEKSDSSCLLDVVRAFSDPVIAGDAAEKLWNPVTHGWAE
jgi:hypothetical protein